MRIEMKVNACEVQDDEVRLLVDVEEFLAMLDEHSPNLLINYLNERYALGIPQLPGRKKGGARCNP